HDTPPTHTYTLSLHDALPILNTLLECFAQCRTDASVRVLDVEDRIVLARLDHLGEIEVHLRFGLAGEHGEADDIFTNLTHNVGESDKSTAALGHLHRLAAAEELDQQDELDVEL